jgi:hypothetical protein
MNHGPLGSFHVTERSRLPVSAWVDYNGAPTVEVRPNPFTTNDSKSSAAEEGILAKVFEAIITLQPEAIRARSLLAAYESLVPMTQAKLATVAKVGHQSSVSRMKGLVLRCRQFDARVEFFCQDTVAARRIEALVRVTIAHPNESSRARGRRAADAMPPALQTGKNAADAIRKYDNLQPIFLT